MKRGFSLATPFCKLGITEHNKDYLLQYIYIWGGILETLLPKLGRRKIYPLSLLLSNSVLEALANIVKGNYNYFLILW